MRKYTIDQYKEMAVKFNKMSFKEKITVISENADILTLANDYNWWGVKAIDKEIQEQLEDEDAIFNIDNEWGHSEMESLLGLLCIPITDI